MLSLRVEAPDLKTSQMLDQLGERLGRSLTEDLVRKSLQRARQKFAILLVGLVADSLETASDAALEEELRALDLLKYCRSALERRRR